MNLDELHAAEYNPRQITNEALEGLMEVLKKYGMVEPIVFNERTKRIIGGHQRVKVLRLMGEKTTQVSILDLSEEDEIELNICLNNENIAGIWDYFKLDPILDKMELQREKEYYLLKIDELRIPQINEDIPDDNQNIDEEEMKKTKNRCPSCNFEW